MLDGVRLRKKGQQHATLQSTPAGFVDSPSGLCVQWEIFHLSVVVVFGWQFIAPMLSPPRTTALTRPLSNERQQEVAEEAR